jgi:hypothetical protein
MENSKIIFKNVVISNTRIVQNNDIWEIKSYHSDFTGKIPSYLKDEVTIYHFPFPIGIEVTSWGNCETHKRGIIFKI